MPTKIKNVQCFIILLIIITLPFSLFSQSEDTEDEESEDYELEKVTVTATKTETEILDVPAHISVITKEDIEDAGVSSVAEIVAQHSGITIQDYGPEGAQTNISIRGSGSKSVLVLLNGVRLNDSRGGGMDLSLISLSSVEKIEILRGGTSALYGADAVGGIVNIITKKENDRKFEIKMGNRSYIPGDAFEVSEGGEQTEVDTNWMNLIDAQEGSISYSDKVDDVHFIVCGDVSHAQNEYVWYDNSDSDDYRRKTNAELLKTNLYTSILFPLFSGELNMTGLLHYSNKGLPGSLTWPSIDAEQTDISGNGALYYTTKNFFTPFLTFDMKMFYKYTSLEYKNPDDYYPVDDLHTTNTIGFDLTQEFLYFDLFSLIYGGNFFYDYVKSTRLETKERIGGGIFIEAPLYLTSFFSITPVVRYDIYSDFPNDITFKVGSVFNLSRSASIKMSASKSYRAPTFNDLYWPDSGNPDLVSETGYGGDIGFSLLNDQVGLDLFGFIRWMQDEIQWSPNESGMWRPLNLGETLYPGLESALHIRVWERVVLNVNYTFNYSFVLKGSNTDYSLEDDLRVPYVPLHTVNLGIEYKDKKNLISVNSRIESERWDDEGNSIRIDPYWIMNASFKRIISNNVTLSFGVYNISTETGQTINEYPLPPVSFKTGIEITF
ncbi:MAG: TonB-dependent receptor [Spirochaetales bacterium]|nr:TonB-dependent receptor [Spirochaetales bacterium]